MSSFKQTQPHLHTTAIGQSTIRTGPVVPKGAVNLAYYVNKKLNPTDNIAISDAIGLVSENVALKQQRVELAVPTAQKLLVSTSGSVSFNTDFIELTNKFKDNIPLFYAYELKRPIFDKNAKAGVYTGDMAKLVVGLDSELIGEGSVHKFELINTNMSDVYKCIVYTEFETNCTRKVYAIYNAATVENGEVTEINPSWKEEVKPLPFMNVGQDYFFKAVQSANPSVDQIIEPKAIEVSQVDVINDTRERVSIRYKIVTNYGQESKFVESYAVHKSVALPHESTMFDGANMLIGLIDGSKIMSAKEMVKTNNSDVPNDAIYSIQVESVDSRVSIAVDPNGEFSPVARVYKESNELIKCPDKYVYKDSTITGMYAIKFKDTYYFELQKPIETEAYENWYPRIQNGIFTKQLGDKKAVYYLNEFKQQQYSFKYGKPYVDVVNEKGVILDSHTVKVRNNNIHIKRNSIGEVTSIGIAKLGTKATPLTIISWNREAGLIEVAEYLSDEEIRVDYSYEERTVHYRGCFADDIFTRIDLNPNKYHTYDKTSYDSTGKLMILDVDNVYNLFNMPVCVFIRPYLVVSTEGTIVNDKTIYHKFDETPFAPDDIMIGKVYLRHNTTFQNLKIIDTRKRGGGLLEEITDDIRKQLEPESDYYFDIGNWDGDPYSENSVVIVRLDDRILKDNGGRFSKEEIQQVVEKWVAYGTLVIVEYLKTFSNNNKAANSIRVERVHVNKLNETVVATCSVFSKVAPPVAEISQINDNLAPYGIIKTIEIKDPKAGIAKGINIINPAAGFTSSKSVNVVEEPLAVSSSITI